MRLLMIVILCLILAYSASAATLSGTIYNLDLEEVKNALVEVNTTPKQRFVSTDGVYSFELPKGTYEIVVRYNSSFEQSKTTELVDVRQEGEFVYDIFLFPDFEEEEKMAEDIETTQMDDGDVFQQSIPFGIKLSFVVAILLFFFVLISMYNSKKRMREEVDQLKRVVRKTRKVMKHPDLQDDLRELVGVIRKQGGRTTQKEIRKEIPMSEAKISLMITELESKGVIRKIKKGRGNVIVLK